MARPIWTGTIGFGLVNVPVKLFSATSPKEVRFHMVHDKDLGRIHQKRVCSIDGEEVKWEHIVKGFEVSKGRYVTLTADELPHAQGKAIEIEDFVSLDEIDPIFYETTYYLVPDKGAAKPYALLLAAMEKTGKVGIARFVLRTKRYLAAVRPMGQALAISTMLFSDEVVKQSELEGLPSSKPSAKEMEMAEQLIGSLVTEFDPAKYKDDYRDEVLALIKKKEKGAKISPEAEEPRATKVSDLMEALQASLASAKKGGAAKPQRSAHRHHAAPVKRARSRKHR
jgi:DNA end-binding protein Ku